MEQLWSYVNTFYCVFTVHIVLKCVYWHVGFSIAKSQLMDKSILHSCWVHQALWAPKWKVM